MVGKFIDVEKIILDKNPKLYRRLPRFVINYLKKILWEDEVNQIIANNEGVTGIQFCKNVIQEFKIDVEIIGIENAPKTGGVTFASNHPLGGIDALAFIDQFSNYRTDIKFIANDILLNLDPMKDIFVGVNKHGNTATPSLKNLDAVLSNDESVVIFPSGFVSRKKNGVVKDLEWKKTFVTRARKHGVPIVPVHIQGELSPFFYRLSRFREFIGIKANIEMLFLVNELFKQKNTSIKIIFGKAIQPEMLDKDVRKDVEWAAFIKEIAFNLKYKA
jgi:1-acyl-sn-glycerol-3-phosphate acyltransferase